MLPKTASAKLALKSKTRVEGTINAYPFGAALTPAGTGSHELEVSKALRDAARVDAGDTVNVEITRVGDEPEIRVPADFRKALAAAPKAKALWEAITPLARRDWVLFISTCKQSETRKGRIDKACDMLAKGKRRVCCFPGLAWLTKEYKGGATWRPLPKAK